MSRNYFMLILKDIPRKYQIKSSVWIETDMFYSAAFKSLARSGSALCTFMRCVQKIKRDKIKVNGKKKYIPSDRGFIFPYAESAALGIAGKTQHWKNIKKLIEVGFLDLVHQGGWYRRYESTSDYNVYKYSERWRKYGTPEFVNVEKQKVLPKQFHVREHIARKKAKVTSLERTRHVHNSEHDQRNEDSCHVHDDEQSKQAAAVCQSLTAVG